MQNMQIRNLGNHFADNLRDLGNHHVNDLRDLGNHPSQDVFHRATRIVQEYNQSCVLIQPKSRYKTTAPALCPGLLFDIYATDPS